MKLSIDDIPTLVSFPSYCDDRGFFSIIDNNEIVLSLEKMDGGRLNIKRIYYISNHTKGIIRGLHNHKYEYKAYVSIKGTFKIAALKIDIGASSLKTFILSDRVSQVLIVPPLWAHGNISLEDNAVLLGMSTSTTQQSLDDDIRYDPYTWGDIFSVKAR
jgi:dTDP-4-dehydrorhamnose 3,5-epimerase-like enzyme